jgi:GTP cyclohydrolase II
LAGTDPTARIGPFPQWFDPNRIVTLDPWGHRVAEVFEKERRAGLDIRPTIAVAEGHLQMAEITQAVSFGRLRPDGHFLTRLGDVLVTKIAIEPVWWLPGVAARLDLTELELREALFNCTDGMFPALKTDMKRKAFLPPIGGTSAYVFGESALLTDHRTKISCRIHDECSGSDVFGSVLCTCRPYLAFAVEEAVRSAQTGGVGVVVYNRKEGRALGEVVKLLVYNARCRFGDRAEEYFDRTRQVAGVSDIRFQTLSTDVLQWLGLTRIDRWISMSNLKADAITAAGIQIVQQVAIPDELIPAHADVEIMAKRAAGYFTAGPTPTSHVFGRGQAVKPT